MTFVHIRPGTFMMGSPPSEPGRDHNETQHPVILAKAYYMQTTEVTQGQWKKVMGNNPSYYAGCGDRCPVENVSWDDCQQFIGKLNQMKGSGRYRLPTEAEWEYACRAGTATPFHTGRCLDANQANFNGGRPFSACPAGRYRMATEPAGSFAPNAWGLHDMHGNVWEWCQDWYGDYPSGKTADPTGPLSAAYRVIRGGGLVSGALCCRSAFRHGGPPKDRSFDLGFRLAWDPGGPLLGIDRNRK